MYTETRTHTHTHVLTQRILRETISTTIVASLRPVHTVCLSTTTCRLRHVDVYTMSLCPFVCHTFSSQYNVVRVPQDVDHPAVIDGVVHVDDMDDDNNNRLVADGVEQSSLSSRPIAADTASRSSRSFANADVEASAQSFRRKKTARSMAVAVASMNCVAVADAIAECPLQTLFPAERFRCCCC